MRLQKLLIISTLVGLSYTPAFSQNNQAETDAKLEEILRQKLSDFDSKGKGARSSAPAESSVPKAPANRSSSAVPSAPVPAANTTAPSDNDARLEELLRQKQMELDGRSGRQGSPSRANQPAVAPAARGAQGDAETRLIEELNRKQAELDAKDESAWPKVKKSSKDSQLSSSEADKRIQKIEAEIRAKEEAIKKRAAAQQARPSPTPAAAPAAPPAPVPATAPSAPAKASAVDAAVSTTTPAKKVSGKNQRNNQVDASDFSVPDPNSKQSRLDDLLRRYKADEITPSEYHKQRAKIVAEP